MTAFSYGLKRGRGKYGEVTCIDLLKRGLPYLNPQDLNEANFSPQSLEGKNLPRLKP